ncbi:MAG: helix-turn-helix domain-containing protein [Candidatus Bathyarchaeia archaeon]
MNRQVLPNKASESEKVEVRFTELKDGRKGLMLGEEEYFVKVQYNGKWRLQLLDAFTMEALSCTVKLKDYHDLPFSPRAKLLREALKTHVKGEHDILNRIVFEIECNEHRFYEGSTPDVEKLKGAEGLKASKGGEAEAFNIERFLVTKPLTDGEKAQYAREAEDRLRDPKLLDWVGSVLDYRIVGEEKAKKLLFLIALSPKTGEPQAAIIQGPPSSGKSHICVNVLRLFPNVINLTRITPAALDRLQVNLSQYILYVSELAGAEHAGPSLRLILSEGELRLATAEADEKGKINPRFIETVGTPVYVTTTTQEIVEEQLASRTWQIRTDTSPEQTRRILAFQAKQASTVQTEGFSHEEMVLRCLIELLEPCHVLIPYAEKLDRLFPSEEPQARRDFKRLLSVIKTLACLFQKQRPVVECQGRKVVLASLNDLAEALKLLKPVLLPTLYGLPQKAFEALAFIKDKGEEKVTVRDVAAKVKLSEQRTRTILNAMVDKGFLYKDESQRTHKYEWSGKELEDISLLSTEISPAFFSLEEFLNWFSANNCSCSEEPKHVYVCHILNEGNDIHTHGLPPSERLQENVEKPELGSELSEKPYKISVSQTEISKPVWLWRRVPPAEKCELCGKWAVEYEVKGPASDNWLRRCEQCFKVLRAMFAKAEWVNSEDASKVNIETSTFKALG